MKPKEYYDTVAKQRHKKEPWYRILKTIKYRCENPNSQDYYRYGGRGIECYLTIENIKFLMTRDNYYTLKYPTIDRKDNDGHYILDNCQFIENVDNVKKAHSRPVIQMNLNDEFIKEWKSQNEASRQLRISQGNIGSCCRNMRSHASGFKWKYKVDKLA